MRKRRQMDVGRGRRTSPQRLRLLERQSTTSRTDDGEQEAKETGGEEKEQEGMDMMGELPQRDEERDEEAAKGAEAAQARRDGTQKIRRHAEEKWRMKRGVAHEAEWRMRRVRHEEGETAPLAGESRT